MKRVRPTFSKYCCRHQIRGSWELRCQNTANQCKHVDEPNRWENISNWTKYFSTRNRELTIPGYKSGWLMEMFGFSDPAASTIVNVNIYLRTIRMLCSNQNKYSNNIDGSFEKSFRKRTPHSIFYIRTINDINDYKMVSWDWENFLFLTDVIPVVGVCCSDNV